MPPVRGRAACADDKRFNIASETERIPRSVANELAKTCNMCELRENCGFRQIYHPTSR